jgi:3-hydroxyisobutyrate dehydrogenase-like beta-hydroxyacid dehydrogenase
MNMNVAVVGTGTMGSVMVGHLVRRGHTVTVWNRTLERAAAAIAAGGSWADTPADASRDADAVVVVLSGDDTVLDVLGRFDGVFAGCRPGTVVIDMSTTAAVTKRKAAAAAAHARVDFLDAPFFGSLKEAQAGGLWPVVGGDPDVLARVSPMLDAFSDRIFHVGPVGAAATVKLAGNLLVLSMVEHLAASLAMIQANDGDPKILLELLGITGFRSPLYQAKGRQMVDGDFAPRGSVDTAIKDLGLIVAAAEAAGIPTAGLADIRARYVKARELGGGELDMASVITAEREQAGVAVHS